MAEIIDEQAPEQPIHPHCRCFMVPILEGDSDDAQLQDSYEVWFDRQPEAKQINIIGPSRFALYKQGHKVTQFSKILDGKRMIATLQDLGADRVSRKRLTNNITDGNNLGSLTSEPVIERKTHPYELNADTLAELKRKVEDPHYLFSHITKSEAEALLSDLQTNHPKELNVIENLKKTLLDFERSEEGVKWLADNGFTFPDSNITIRFTEQDINTMRNNPEEMLRVLNKTQEGDKWGQAHERNTKAKAFVAVNGGNYQPIVRDRGMVTDYRGSVPFSYVQTFMQMKNDANKNIELVTVSELLRADTRQLKWLNSLKVGDVMELTGTTSFAANPIHTDVWLQGMIGLNNSATSAVKYHLELSDSIRDRVGMIQLDDLKQGITNRSMPSELLLSGNSLKITRIEKRGDFWEIWLKND